MKKQIDYTFDEAKDAAVNKLTVLAKFAESLSDLDKTLLEWAVTLRAHATKVRRASGRCLSDAEIKLVWGFGQELIRGSPDLKSQLSQFWSLYDEVIKKLPSTRRTPGYAPQGVIDSLRHRINHADMLARDRVLAARSQVSNVLSPTALLLVHVIRTETIEYALKEQLKDAVQKHNLQAKYDIEVICSVQSKVKKGPEWQTDVRAIRDATAHGQFRIRLFENDWAIEFDNNAKGYSFHKHFSREDFTKFFDLHTLLYKVQLHLLEIIELLPILATHLHKQL